MKSQDWPASEIVRRETADLIPYARNSRTHSQSQIRKIAASIKEWGWTNPVLIDEEGGVIAGHGRLLAAELLRIREVPCIVAKGWTKAQQRAYVIADNQLALDAGWDQEMLRVELEEIEEMGFDLDLVGFDEKELDDIMSTGGPIEEGKDKKVEPVPDPISELGTLWILGNHRLLCGDSTDAAQVDRLLAGAKPGLMVTDPPYGVEYDAEWRNEAGISATKQTGKVHNDDRASWSAAFRHFPGDVAYVWHAGLYASQVERSLAAVGLELRQQIVWVKHRFAISRGNYHWRHEPCWYAVRKNGSADWQGGRKQNTVWADIVDMPDAERGELFATRINEDQVLAFDASATTVWEIRHDAPAGGGHSTQKPVECMARPMRNHKMKLVYEPFAGSGTTVIAAQALGRTCFAMELDPRYVDAIVRRWQEHTGREAVNEATGLTFAESRT